MSAETVRAIDRRDVAGWVERLLERSEVVAPVRTAEGDTHFATVSAPAQVLWEFENPLTPPKSLLLPQTDPLVRIHRSNGRHELEAPPAPAPSVLLNAHPCDAAALVYVRQRFAEAPADASVLRRAEALTVVALACDRPCTHGFCICCDAGPFLREGFDLQLTALDGCYHVEVGSPKGQALLDLAPSLFREATDAERDARARAEERARGSFGEETCHFGAAMRRISTHRVPDALWDAMAPWCLECGGCNFACPTCYCFNVSDRVVPDAGDEAWVRCRTWDSCQYAAFTLEASGHNPRTAHRERLKRRFFHKASAQYFVREGRLGCVGCGRCIQVCMGSTDMPAVIGAVRKGTWDGGREL